MDTEDSIKDTLKQRCTYNRSVTGFVIYIKCSVRHWAWHL